jgi:Zn-dependent protease
VLHELGHALMARYFGIATRDITLYPIGGVARLERMSERPWEELCIALAGPAVNVAIALMLFWVLLLGGVLFTPALLIRSLGAHFLLDLLALNVWLVLFNLLPAFPMDGGRVLRALLSLWLGHLRATEIAATIGVGMAVLFVLVGLVGFQSLMLALVGLFIYLVGQQELAMARHREAARRIEPIFPGAVDVQPVSGPHPVDGQFTGFTWDSRTGAWIQWQNGWPVRSYRVNLE